MAGSRKRTGSYFRSVLQQERERKRLRARAGARPRVENPGLLGETEAYVYIYKKREREIAREESRGTNPETNYAGKILKMRSRGSISTFLLGEANKSQSVLRVCKIRPFLKLLNELIRLKKKRCLRASVCPQR